MADALDRNAVITTLARCIAAVASGDDDGARGMILDLAGGYAKERQGTLPGLPSPSPRVDHYAAAIERIYDYWKERCDHPHARLTPERRRAVLARLRENRSESEIKCAIDGAASSAYTNQAGKTFNDLELICRNGTKLEDFIDRGLAAGSAHTVGLLDAHGAPTSPSASVDLEQEIAQLRHNMSLLRQQGRDTEYNQAADQLDKLLASRRKRS
jgi:hypothetical protein